jgi:hypothetical protein
MQACARATGCLAIVMLALSAPGAAARVRTEPGTPPSGLSASAEPPSAAYGGAVLLSLTGLPADAIGDVTFSSSGANLCSAPVSLGAAACTTAVLPVGSYAVTAAYPGSAGSPAASATTAFTITPPFTFIAPPSVQIASPADASDAPGLVSCLGTVPIGAPIDTTRAGTYAFAVTGISLSGESTIATLHYLVYVPPNRIALLQPELKNDGTGSVVVHVPGPGTLTALETAWPNDQRQPPVGRQTVLSRGQLTARRAGHVTVTVAPVSAARQLLRHSRGRRLRVRLSITYTPAGGDPRETSKYGLLSIR